MCGSFVSQPSFPFQVWPDLERSQDSADPPEEFLHSLTRPCFLLLLERFFSHALPLLLETYLSSQWRALFPPHTLALTPFFLAKVRLSLTLAFLLLTIWWSGQMVLFLFLLAKTALAYLPTAHLVAPRPPFPFRQAQYAQFFSLKLAPFCQLSASLGSTNKHAISLLLLSYSRPVLATMSSLPPFLLSQSLWQIWQELFSLSSCTIRLQLVPGHSFLPWNDATNELVRAGECYYCPS